MTLDRTLSASFPLDGSPAVVVGSPEALGKSAGEWVITAGHEIFHVYQAAMGSYEKVASLEIGSREDSTCQLRFPFPYMDPQIMKLIHLQGNVSWLASLSTRIPRNPGTRSVQRLKRHRCIKRAVAAYTEFRLAETAARQQKVERRSTTWVWEKLLPWIPAKA